MFLRAKTFAWKSVISYQLASQAFVKGLGDFAIILS